MHYLSHESVRHNFTVNIVFEQFQGDLNPLIDYSELKQLFPKKRVGKVW